MPTYDFRCASGHTTEERTDRSQRGIACPECDLLAERLSCYPGRTPAINGIVTVPMAERRIPLDRFVEAQHSLVDEAERKGTHVPDLLDVAKRQAREIQRLAPELIG